MHVGTRKDNLLYELARTMTARGHHSTATALRRFAHEGFATLEQVDNTPDWVLLSIPGIGPGRLGAVRRLTQPDWQPPSRQAARTAGRLFSAAQLALRFWRIEDLEAVLGGAAPPPATGDQPVEAQLSLETFVAVAGEASAHHEPDALLRLVRRAALSAREGIRG